MADDNIILRDLAARIEQSGGFPLRDRFRADHGSRLHALNDLENRGLLRKRGKFEIWTPAAIRQIAREVHFAQAELDRALLVLKELQSLYRSQLDKMHPLAELGSRLGWTDLDQLRRAVAIQPPQALYSVDVFLEGEVGRLGIDEQVLLLDAEEVFGPEVVSIPNKAPSSEPGASPVVQERPQEHSAPPGARIEGRPGQAAPDAPTSRRRRFSIWIPLLFIALLALAALAISSVGREVPHVPLCEIAPPKSSRLAAATKVAGQLKGVVASADVHGGLTTEEQGVVERSFEQVPDAVVACQMIIQAAVCLEQISKSDAARDMRAYIPMKCPNAVTLPVTPEQQPAPTVSVSAPTIPTVKPAPSTRSESSTFKCLYLVHVNTNGVESSLSLVASDRKAAEAQCEQRCTTSRDTWRNCRLQ